MKILVFGAGIIGSVYAAKLFEAKSDVTLLARGKRYENLRTNGILLKDSTTGKQTETHVPLIESLEINDLYDLIIVAVRLDQLDDVVAVLKSNAGKQIMFMMNNPQGAAQLSGQLKSKHILLAFPGVGGANKNNAIEYICIKQQPTTIGEITGNISAPVLNLQKIFQHAGFKVGVCNDMQSWLKIHAVFISCISAALANENDDSVQLANDKNNIRLMVKSIKEGFKACKLRGLPILPFNLKILFMIMPEWFAVFYWQRTLKANTGKLAIAPHAKAAKKEMQMLAQMVLDMVHSSGGQTLTLNTLLLSFINNNR
jgi:2-dehydropantoate 2-reductase